MFYKTEHGFNGRGTFSNPNIYYSLGPVPAPIDHNFSYGLKLKNIINIDLKLLSNPESRPQNLNEPIQALISLLTSYRTLKLDNTTKEKEYCLEFAKKILLPLFGEVIFEMGYADYIEGVQGATVEHLGLGSESTWHGVMGMRIRGCDFVTTIEHLHENSDSDDSSSNDKPLGTISPGNTINIKGKKVSYQNKNIVTKILCTRIVLEMLIS